MFNKYIVTFKDGTPKADVDKSISEIEAAGGKITHRYDPSVLNGFAAAIPDSHFQHQEKITHGMSKTLMA